MPQEIERKFLLSSSDWRKEVKKSYPIIQGYLCLDENRTVRVRIKDQQGILTVKGKTQGITRLEFEYNIPYEDANKLIQLCEEPLIEKTRFLVEVDDNTWEIDEFSGENQGLVIAEIELESENQQFTKPNWIGEEVSHDRRFYNSSLIKQPFTKWH